METLRALEEALLNYAGCAVVISHDRWFLDRIATHMLAFEGDSRVVWFEGNYQGPARRIAAGRLGAEADTPHRIKYRRSSHVEDIAMTPEQAKGAAMVVTGMWQGEVAATTQVLAAVKDATRDYKPDAKSRSAWEIARHIAGADTWFIDSIIAGQFQWDPEAAKKSEAKFTSAQSVADYTPRPSLPS